MTSIFRGIISIINILLYIAIVILAIFMFGNIYDLLERLKILTTLLIILCLIMILISGLLLIYINKKKSIFLQPWIIVSIFGLTLSCIQLLCIIKYYTSEENTFNIISFFKELLTIGFIGFLCWIIPKPWADQRSRYLIR